MLPTLLLITICHYDCQCFHLSVCQSIHMSVSQFFHLNANQSTQMQINLFKLPAYLLINLSIYKSIAIPAQLADIKKKASLSNVFCKNNKKLKWIQLKAMEKTQQVCESLQKSLVSVVLSNSFILLIHSLHRVQYKLCCRTPLFSLYTVYIDLSISLCCRTPSFSSYTVYIELSISCVVELLHSLQYTGYIETSISCIVELLHSSSTRST